MEELATNLTQEDVLEIIQDFPLEPARGRVIVTVNTEELEELDLRGAGLAETQFVLAVSPNTWEKVVPGCRVLLDLEKMSIRTGENTYEIAVDPVKVDGRVYAFINDNFIKSIDNR